MLCTIILQLQLQLQLVCTLAVTVTRISSCHYANAFLCASLESCKEGFIEHMDAQMVLEAPQSKKVIPEHIERKIMEADTGHKKQMTSILMLIDPVAGVEVLESCEEDFIEHMDAKVLSEDSQSKIISTHIERKIISSRCNVLIYCVQDTMVVLYTVKCIHSMHICLMYTIIICFISQRLYTCGPLWCRHVEVLESYEKEVFKCMDACAHTSPLFIRGSVVEQGYSRA